MTTEVIVLLCHSLSKKFVLVEVDGVFYISGVKSSRFLSAIVSAIFHGITCEV